MKRILPFSFVALLAVSSLAACAHSQAPAESPQAPAAQGDTKATKVVAPGDAKPGDKTTCPISGEEFVVSEASPHSEYNGKTYYFCCAGCKAKFDSDPAKFTGPKS